MTEVAKPPSRAVAVVLAIFGPLGIGQLYLGQTRRAVVWFAVPTIVLVVAVKSFAAVGHALGFGFAFVAFFGGALLAWAGSIVDLFLVREDRLAHKSNLLVFGFFVAGFLLNMGVRAGIRRYGIEAFKIPSGAMQPTLLVGDHVFVDKHAHAPKRGEVIVFKYPEHPEQDFVKRVIAVGGDKLEVRRGHPVINGWEVPHCRIGKASMPTYEGTSSTGELDLEFLDGEAYLVFFDEQALASEYQGPFHAAPNEFWVLGDNRNNSHDSRMWFGGTGGGVPLDYAKGRALFRWLHTGDDQGPRFGTAIDAPLLPASMKALEGDLARCQREAPPREKTVPPPSRGE